MSSIASEAHRWTASLVEDSADQRSTNLWEYVMAESRNSCFSGFSSFMRWVALWEMGRRGEVTCVFQEIRHLIHRAHVSRQNQSGCLGLKLLQRCSRCLFLADPLAAAQDGR